MHTPSFTLSRHTIYSIVSTHATIAIAYIYLGIKYILGTLRGTTFKCVLNVARPISIQAHDNKLIIIYRIKPHTSTHTHGTRTNILYLQRFVITANKLKDSRRCAVFRRRRLLITDNHNKHARSVFAGTQRHKHKHPKTHFLFV